MLIQIERFLRENGMKPSVFGQKVANDPRLVFDIRRGREVRSKLRQRITDYIASNSASGGAQ